MEVAIEPSLSSQITIPVDTIDLDSPNITQQSRGRRGPYKKKPKVDNNPSVVTNNNLCNDSGTFIFTTNMYTLSILCYL